MGITNRSFDDVWAEIQHRSRELMARRVALPTVVDRVPNVITGVFDDRIERQSTRPRSATGVGAHVRRSTVHRIWRDLDERGSTEGIRSLRFALALVSLIPGVAVEGNHLVLADRALASRPFIGNADGTLRYWWSEDPNERYWVEIRYAPNLGTELRCPVPGDGWHRLVDAVRPGDIIYHWHAKESQFVGRSIALDRSHIVGAERFLPLGGFAPIQDVVDLAGIRSHADDIYEVRERVYEKFERVPCIRTAYLPFQFRSDGLRMMSNYFAKLPRQLVMELFGESGWGRAVAVPSHEEVALPSADSTVPVRFLEPFRPKADTEYVTRIVGHIQTKSRHHETLVNDFSQWLISHNLQPGRNAVIDIGLLDPPVVIEAKVFSGSWPAVIRAAIGQLYEYRFFKVARKDARLILLASHPVPSKWIDYLWKDRHVACAWRDGSTFFLTAPAKRTLGL